MGPPVTLYRFRVELSDIDRNHYESLDLRVAMHPSETHQYLITRLIAYALNAELGAEFSPEGLSDPDVPALAKANPNGGFSLWIEIGNPSAKKLHRATKAAKLVKVYTYKDPQALVREMAGNAVHRIEQVEAYALNTKFLDRLTAHLERDNSWAIVLNQGELTVSIGESSETTELARIELK